MRLRRKSGTKQRNDRQPLWQPPEAAAELAPAGLGQATAVASRRPVLQRSDSTAQNATSAKVAMGAISTTQAPKASHCAARAPSQVRQFAPRVPSLGLGHKSRACGGEQRLP